MTKQAENSHKLPHNPTIPTPGRKTTALCTAQEINYYGLSNINGLDQIDITAFEKAPLQMYNEREEKNALLERERERDLTPPPPPRFIFFRTTTDMCCLWSDNRAGST
jgi:hypothetical protein